MTYIVLKDTFSRTVTNPPYNWWDAVEQYNAAWMNAFPEALQWSTSETYDYWTWSVNGSEGQLYQAPNNYIPATLRAPGRDYWSWGTIPREFEFRVKFDTLTTTEFEGYQSVKLILRRQEWQTYSAEYTVEFELARSGYNNRITTKLSISGYGGSWTETYATGDAGAADEWVWCKARIDGWSPTTISVKMWVDGDTEPGWQGVYEDDYSALQTLGMECPWDSELKVTAGATFSLDDVLVTSDYVETYGGTFPVDAVIKRTQTPTGFPVAAWKQLVHYHRSGDFAATSLVKATIPSSFAASAIKLGTQGPRTWFHVDAFVRPPSSGSFPIEYRVYDPANPIYGTPGQPARRVPTKIIVGGAEITPHVEWATARFTAKVNGAVGDCSFAVRDDAHELEFTFGQEIKLLIDGVVRWGGWVLRPQRTFAMSVQPEPVTSPRIWQIEGVDYNAIFDKRILHDLRNPEHAWNYEPGSYDDTVIWDLWKYFDMEGFTLSVERVGVAILDIPGVTAKGKKGGLLASGGFTLRDVMTSIIRNTAAIFYCSPTKVITYVDSDKVNSIYTLTDRPY